MDVRADALQPVQPMLTLAQDALCGYCQLERAHLTARLRSPRCQRLWRSCGTEGRIIALSNALYLVFHGRQNCLLGPAESGLRRWTGVVAVLLTLACSIGTALSPTIASFFAFRILTAFCGTAPIVLAPL